MTNDERNDYAPVRVYTPGRPVTTRPMTHDEIAHREADEQRAIEQRQEEDQFRARHDDATDRLASIDTTTLRSAITNARNLDEIKSALHTILDAIEDIRTLRNINNDK